MNRSESRTDWTEYYQRPFPAARVLRRITGSVLLHTLRRKAVLPDAMRVVEFGGGNSCFASRLTAEFPCSCYTVVDTNPEGLELFRKRSLPCVSETVCGDVRTYAGEGRAHLAFSAGLIEHFSPEETETVVQNHFSCVRAGGYAAFLFPVDTLLYRAVRGAAEICGLWRFPDERPLAIPEIQKIGNRYGRCLCAVTIRSILLTQALLLFRKELK